MKFSIKDFFSKCYQMVTFTEEILNGKPHFFFAVLVLNIETRKKGRNKYEYKMLSAEALLRTLSNNCDVAS